MIEECVTQIVLHKAGHDPDFRATKRFNIDVAPVIDTLIGNDLLKYTLNFRIQSLFFLLINFFFYYRKIPSGRHKTSWGIESKIGGTYPVETRSWC